MSLDCLFDWDEITRVSGPCTRPGGDFLTARALEVCRMPKGARIADIGCGAGGTLELLGRTGAYRTVGLDSSGKLAGEAIPRPLSGRLVRGRAESLPFREGCFDAVFCECVLSLLSERTAALHEFARVLKEEGFLVLSDVFGREATGGPKARAGPQRTGEGPPKKGELLGVLAALGFSTLLWEEHEKLLGQFAARLILAGVHLPDPWGCKRGQIGYFLLVGTRGAPPGPGRKGR